MKRPLPRLPFIIIVIGAIGGWCVPARATDEMRAPQAQPAMCEGKESLLVTEASRLDFKGAESQTLEQPSQPRGLTFEKAVHFLTPDGNDVVIGPGEYEVNATEGQLVLTPTQGEVRNPIAVEAERVSHDARLESPLPHISTDDGEQYRAGLFFPDKTGFMAVGTTSGIQSRTSTGPITRQPQLWCTIKCKVKCPPGNPGPCYWYRMCPCPCSCS